MNDWDATLTLWQASAPPGCSSEDSIRAHDTFPIPGKTKPRFRTLEDSGEQPPDFKLGEEIGSGGMGVVYAANQTAFDREVAVKMIKPGSASSAADALMAEAVVTGRLEHPNVVPVYDLGVDAAGNLFYAMKEIQGSPWSEVIAEKSLDENLDILLRVADTVSFAHSRGILHRDLKPHNVMIGDFGEVMVLDWGASCALDDRIHGADTLCGTPAYMPPEMACGDFSRLGVGGDVYLLGAVLYHILTGHPPRREKDPVLCIVMASENHIEPAEDSELLRIALKAMATVPAERFSNVRNFQNEIRIYRSHEESLALFSIAKSHLKRAGKQGEYDAYAQAIFGFKAALELWEGNAEALNLKDVAQQQYARCAFEKKDYELALSLLDVNQASHGELRDLIESAMRDRDAHKKRIRRLLFTARILILAIVLIFGFSFFMIQAEQQKTREEHRRSLVHLISAYYGEQNYEATIATFWELFDQYGMADLDEDTLLDIRIAANMNPYRGSIETGVKEVVGIKHASEEGSVWVIGKQELTMVQLNPTVDYKPDTLVAIHDFKFGKCTAPGFIGKTVKLPFPLSCGETFNQAKDGTLWIGSGSVLYRQDGERWNPVLDVSQLDYPPLPGKYNIDRDEVEKWMASAGKKQSITGILIDEQQRSAAIALGPQTVGWFDLETRQCVGWLAVGHGTLFHEMLTGEEGEEALLVLSSDESKLAFCPSAQNASMVFYFDLPTMTRSGYAYTRDYPVRAVSCFDENRFVALAQDGQFFSPTREFFSPFDTFSYGKNGPNKVRWGTELCRVRELQQNDVQLAVFNQDGSSCISLTENGLLYLDSSTEGGFESVRKVVSRKQIAGLYARQDSIVMTNSKGVLHFYDLSGYSIVPLSSVGMVESLAKSEEPDAVIAGIMQTNGVSAVIRMVLNPEDSGVTATPLLFGRKSALCCDPAGRYLATSSKRLIAIRNIENSNDCFGVEVTGSIRAVPQLHFDDSGEYFWHGGDWQSDLLFYRTSDWKELHSIKNSPGPLDDDESHFTHVLVDNDGDRRSLIYLKGSPKKVVKMRLPENGGPPVPEWTMKNGSTPMAIIPFSDPINGKRKYWCKLWFQDFQLYDAVSGEASVYQNHWMRTGVGHPEFISNDPRVVFPMESGLVQIALKSDLFPVFDPRILGFKVEKVVLNTDSSRLYLLGEGRLHCMKLPSFQ